jgi:hypothetical protein
MRGKQYFMFDIETLKTISLDEIVREDAHEALRQLVAAKLRDFMGIEKTVPLSQGGFFTDEAEITENFFLTSEGLGFHWDPYEIAPYAAGPIEIIIPYDELAEALVLEPAHE